MFINDTINAEIFPENIIFSRGPPWLDKPGPAGLSAALGIGVARWSSGSSAEHSIVKPVVKSPPRQNVLLRLRLIANSAMMGTSTVPLSV